MIAPVALAYLLSADPHLQDWISTSVEDSVEFD
jgi:hypothetical protein